jgi:hypothetical protein
MRKLAVLGSTVFALAAFAGAMTTPATAARPVGHVVSSFEAQQVQTGPFGTNVTPVRIAVDAYDAFGGDPSDNPTTPTGDWGAVDVTFLDTGERRVFEATNVVMSVDGSQATIWTDTFFFELHDGGSPGSDAVGPPGPGGVSPTRDWYRVGQFGSGGLVPVRGYLTSGEIELTSPFSTDQVGNPHTRPGAGVTTAG